MSLDFIDSESCEIDGERLLYFRGPRQLRDKIIETLSEIGPEKFFSSTDASIKKVRESMAEFFLLLALKRDTGQDWLLMQPEDDPPDFVLMTASDNPITITLDEFELVEVPGRCETDEEMFKIIRSKLKKGYPEKRYHLLIFMNNTKSKEWVNKLNKGLGNDLTFKSVWTVHLLWYKNQGGLYGCVVNRLRSYPIRHIETPLSDDGLDPSPHIPFFMEEIVRDGKTFLIFKEDFARELTKSIRKLSLKKK